MYQKRFFTTYTKEFFRHWGSYIVLFFSMNLLLRYIFIPIFSFFTAKLMQWGDIPYVNHKNLLTILTHQPLITLGLIILLFLLLMAIFMQFSFLMLGIRNIQRGKGLQLIPLLKESFSKVHQVNNSSFLYFLLYFIFILPFAGVIFETPLLSKIKIPIFVLDYLNKNDVLKFLLGFLYVVIVYLGIRLLYVLPNMILKNQSAPSAFRASWRLTRKHVLFLLWRISIITLLSSVLFFTTNILFYVLQFQCDQLSDPWPLIAGILNLTLMQITSQLIVIWGTVLFISLILPPLSELQNSYPAKKSRLPFIIRIIAVGFLLITGTFTLIENGLYLSGLATESPLVISHRGVSNENGVQNTIPAMAKTIKLKPDYIEMDIHETKDRQFVVMHDENLKELAGLDKAPHELTLAELTALTVRENGHEAKIASFNEYLDYANKHDQKLLIEIKTTKADSADLLDRFIKKYEKTILAHQHRIHSLDYNVVTGLKEKAPQLYVSFILPYNFTFPQTDADAYTMEETTLNRSFILQAQGVKKDVYAWTVNDADSMDNMIFLDVDGIITDNLETLKAVIKNFEDDPSYADRLLLYFDQLAQLGRSSNEN